MLPIVEWSICCSYFLCFVLTKFRPLLSPRMKHNLLKAGDRHVLLLTWWCGLTGYLPVYWSDAVFQQETQFLSVCMHLYHMYGNVCDACVRCMFVESCTAPCTRTTTNQSVCWFTTPDLGPLDALTSLICCFTQEWRVFALLSRVGHIDWFPPLCTWAWYVAKFRSLTKRQWLDVF